jgi:hypothetical protein
MYTTFPARLGGENVPAMTYAAPTATQPARELAFREADGLQVALLWHQRCFLSVTVHDSKTGEAFELVLDEGDDALDVFYHPFAYAAYRGLDGAGQTREPALAVAP